MKEVHWVDSVFSTVFFVLFAVFVMPFVTEIEGYKFLMTAHS